MKDGDETPGPPSTQMSREDILRLRLDMLVRDIAPSATRAPVRDAPAKEEPQAKENARPPRYRRWLRAAQGSVNEMLVMIDGLLQLQRLESRALQVNRCDCDLTALAEGVVEQLRVIAGPAEVQIESQGKSSGWKELTRVTAPIRLHEGSLAGDMTVRFRRLRDDPAPEVPVQYDDWGLIRLIEEGRAERTASGTVWRVRIRLESKEAEVSGDTLFEIRLNRPLPKVEDWPRQ